MKCFRLIIKGKVQGVYFRVFARQEAMMLDLVGSIKNLKNGNVEIIVCGMDSKLSQLIEWCLNGSRNAVVGQLRIDQIEMTQLFSSFEIIR